MAGWAVRGWAVAGCVVAKFSTCIRKNGDQPALFVRAEKARSERWGQHEGSW